MLLFSTSQLNAAQMNVSNYSNWLSSLEQEAIDSGISPAVVHDALDNAMLDDRVVALDQKQPETTINFDTYSDHLLSLELIEQGHALLQQHAAILKTISDMYGVPPQIIVALWGIESHYGHNSGKYQIVDSLLTLAYEGRRADFFRGELINALRILDQEHIPASALRGSWAGAMGQCQFMPSTYMHYAVDYNQNGRRDIWNNTADVFASIANYLASEGWSRDLTWGREVNLSQPIDAQFIGTNQKKSLEEWSALGVSKIDDDPLPAKDLEASLVQPDGETGRSFLIYDNYRAILRWNHSTYFALSVGLLADELK